ncbi:unnamed protein product [Orchesella dallaii]|uniref:Strawberry notch helicase C domain-containing protein n=1 Tax=Orchesella dallaii TaxID=48710 RepID=A0ABP1SAD6_9HEXA
MSAILRQVMTQMGIKLGLPKVYLQNGKTLRIGGWTDEDERKKNSTVDNAQEFEDTFDDGDKSSKIPRLEKDEFEYWPKYSVGAYLSEVTHPLTTWSYQEGLTANKKNLARLYHELVPFLPINPLDELTDRVGVEKVVELTGRKFRYIFDDENLIWTKVKKETNEEGFKEFKNLKKRVCIISTAASTGYSLHSDKSFPNKQQRVHITLEYSWSPDQVLQQLGRSHRSNQAIEPIYYIIQSPIPGEVRFLAIVAKRLKQLANANLLASKLSDVVCSAGGVAAVNKAINTLAMTYGEMMDSVKLGTIGSTKSYFTRTNEDGIAKCFNRNLMLPMDAQKQFLEAVHKELSISNVSDYSPLVELPNKCTEITFKDVQNYQVSSDSSLQVSTFVTSRIAKREYIQGVLKTLSKPAKFYIKNPGIETVIVVETELKDIFDAYFPYNKILRRITAQDLTGYVIVESEGVFFSSWDYIVSSLESQPGCYHLVADGGCLIKDCMQRWAIRETIIITGFSSFFLKQMIRSFDIKFRLAKVNYTKDEKECKCVGLLLETKNQRQALNFIKQKFKKC